MEQEKVFANKILDKYPKYIKNSYNSNKNKNTNSTIFKMDQGLETFPKMTYK